MNCMQPKMSLAQKITKLISKPMSLSTDKMVHSKLMLIDNRQVIAGAANLSVFSMRKAVELDVVVRGLPRFLESVQAESRRRIAEGHPVESPDGLKPYNRVVAGLQQLHQWLT